MPSAKELLEEFIAMLGEGRREEAAERYLAEDVVVFEPPSIPYGGEWVGHQGWADFSAKLNETWTEFDGGDKWFAQLEAEDIALYRQTFRATSRATGRKIEMSLLEAFTFKDNKIVHVDVYYKDAAALLNVVTP